VLAGLRTDLSNAATQLTAAVNSAYNPGGTGTNFFQASPTSGIIALDPTLTASTLRTTTTGKPSWACLRRLTDREPHRAR